MALWRTKTTTPVSVTILYVYPEMPGTDTGFGVPSYQFTVADSTPPLVTSYLPTLGASDQDKTVRCFLAAC